MSAWLLNPLNPWLLSGLGLAAIPILLHLILRQKPKRLEFPPLRLLKIRQQANRRRLRLQHWLLLLFRIAVVVLFVLALVRPRTQAAVGLLTDPKAPVAAVLVFDTSPRLEYRLQNQTRLEVARDLARWLLGQFPEESQVSVVDLALAGEQFTSGFLDPAAAESRLARLEITLAAGELGTAVSSAYLALQPTDEKLRKEIYIFSDLSLAAWPETTLKKLAQQMQAQPNVAVYVLDVGATQPKNISLGEVQISQQVVTKNNPVFIRSRLEGLGQSQKKTVDLYLLDKKGQPVKRDSKTVEVVPGQPQQLEFALGALDVGPQQGYVQAVGKDALEVDDVGYFSLLVKPTWRVLLVSATDEQASFLHDALAPEEFRRKQLARYDCQRISYAQLPSWNLVQQYSAVCLLDPPPLAPPIWDRLREYAQSGGGLAIFLGRAARSDPASFARPEAQAVLPGKLTQVGRSPDGKVHLAPNPFGHPLLTEFRDLEGGGPWSFFPVFNYWILSDVPSEAQLVIPYNTSASSPALLERRLGAGTVLTMTTPISDSPRDPQSWNRLVLDWPFVMLADQMLLYLAGSLDGRANFQVGEAAVLSLPEKLLPTTLQTTVPNGDSFRVTTSPGQRELVLPPIQLPRPGNYRVQGPPEAKVDLGFSLNLPRSVSRLERIELKQLESAFEDLPFQVARTKEEIQDSSGRGRTGQELFSVLIVVLALILAGEYVLANRFYRADPV